MLRNYWLFLNFQWALMNSCETLIEIMIDLKYVPDSLQGVCFDTTKSSAGAHIGAISVIQQAFEDIYCYYPSVFDQFLKFCGPQITIFSRFVFLFFYVPHVKVLRFVNLSWNKTNKSSSIKRIEKGSWMGVIYILIDWLATYSCPDFFK